VALLHISGFSPVISAIKSFMAKASRRRVSLSTESRKTSTSPSCHVVFSSAMVKTRRGPNSVTADRHSGKVWTIG